MPAHRLRHLCAAVRSVRSLLLSNAISASFFNRDYWPRTEREAYNGFRSEPSIAALGPAICLATAHPAKFLDSLEGVPATATPPVPVALRGLLRLPRRCVFAPNKACVN
jgi:hypothetical protein